MQKFPVRPIGDRVIAKSIEDEEELHIQDSEFLLAKNDHSKPMKAEVIEISENFDSSGLNLKVGDVILIPKYGSTEIKIGEKNERYQMCHKKDIIGIL